MGSLNENRYPRVYEDPFLELSLTRETWKGNKTIGPSEDQSVQETPLSQVYPVQI